MKIIKILVWIHTGAADFIDIYTDLPAPFPPEVSEDPLRFRSEATAGRGLRYALEHFPDVPIWTLDVRGGGEQKQVR